MRGRTLIVALGVVIATATCARLGFWQLERLGGKKRMNADRRAALAAPPVALGDLSSAHSLAGRLVSIQGRYDNTRHVLLAGRTHDGESGVEVLTPLMPSSGPAILIDRGWLGAELPAEAHPERSADPGDREVRGLLEMLPPARGATLRPVPGDSVTILLALRLDPDTLAARFPYPVARFILRELPGPGVGPVPLRTPPQPLDESVHLGYAVQWFAMAAIIAGGSIALALRQRIGRRTPMKMTLLALAVLGAVGITPVTHAATARATFAGGCFWSSESMFEGLKGVTSVVSGYSGGTVKNPTYEQVCDGKTGHAEAVEVTYDPAQISYAQLVDLYWRNIDPTQVNASFCDHGSQYRSVIFYQDAAQKKIAEQSKARIEKTQPKFRGRIAVAIEPYTNFYPAEAYHQDFAEKNPQRYQAYRVGCGRDRRLKELWGAPGRQGPH